MCLKTSKTRCHMPVSSCKSVQAYMLSCISCMKAWISSELSYISRTNLSWPWIKILEIRGHMHICPLKSDSCMHAWLYMMHDCMNMLQIRCICNFKVKNEFSMIKNLGKEVSHALLKEMSVHACIHAFKMHGHAYYAWKCRKWHEIIQN